MKALRCVKSFEGFLLLHFFAKMSVGAHHQACRGSVALERNRRRRAGVFFSPVRDFSLAAVGLRGGVCSIVHLLVLSFSS